MSKARQPILFGILLVLLLGAMSIVPRHSFWGLFGLFVLSFVAYFFLLKEVPKMAVVIGVGIWLVSRLVFFFELPLLSDDFYRFIWDGMLLNEGFGAVGNIPSQVDINALNHPGFADALYTSMNSPNYPSIYPPFHQLLGGMSYFVAGDSLLGNVNALRGFILLSELILVVYVCQRAYSMLKCLWIYLFNPLVILEGVGNVHIEAVLVPFLGIGLIALIRHDRVVGALGWASAVLLKLVPLILTPMIFFRLKCSQRWVFAAVSLVVLLLSFLIFSPMDLAVSFADGMGIYYGLFEFNASIYYVLRAVLTPLFGYNPIGMLAPALGLLTLLLMVFVAYFKRKAPLFELALVMYLFYLATSAIVHPWYLLPVVFLAAFAERRYILIWSCLVMLSYSHYIDPFGPKWILIAVEYFGLVVAVLLEGKRRKWLLVSWSHSK